jgi:hypothetical protein
MAARKRDAKEKAPRLKDLKCTERIPRKKHIQLLMQWIAVHRALRVSTSCSA